MASATIEFPYGQHANAGAHLRLKLTYTGDPPGPADVHLLARETGQSAWSEVIGMDVDPAVAAAGLDLNIPVGSETGAFDVSVEWTWKDPPRREEGCIGQYFVDPAPPPQTDPSDAPDDDETSTESTWWKWLLLPITGPVDVGLLVVYAPFYLANLFGFGNPLQRWIKALLELIRDNLLPPTFSGWGK